jgi:hypothetical protein
MATESFLDRVVVPEGAIPICHLSYAVFGTGVDRHGPNTACGMYSTYPQRLEVPSPGEGDVVSGFVLSLSNSPIASV